MPAEHCSVRTLQGNDGLHRWQIVNERNGGIEAFARRGYETAEEARNRGLGVLYEMMIEDTGST